MRASPSSADTLYNAIVCGDPHASAYYRNLPQRIADGRRAEAAFEALDAVHQQRKAKAMNTKMRMIVGAELPPPGSYRTPNGKILTPAALAQLLGLMRDATYPMASIQDMFASASSSSSSAARAVSTSAQPMFANILAPKIETTASLANQATMVVTPTGPRALGKRVDTGPTVKPTTAAELKEAYTRALQQGRTEAVLKALKTQWQNAEARERAAGVITNPANLNLFK